MNNAEPDSKCVFMDFKCRWFLIKQFV